MCLHGSYICLNRIPRKMTTPAEWESLASLRAVPSPKEACSNCAIHDRAPFFCWRGTTHRHSGDGIVCIRSWNWHPGVLDFYPYLISSPVGQYFSTFPSVQSWCLLTMNPTRFASFSHRVNWGTCSHQVPGPENIQKACTFVEKVLAHPACNKSQTAHLYIQYSGLVYLRWYLPNLGLLG